MSVLNIPMLILILVYVTDENNLENTILNFKTKLDDFFKITENIKKATALRDTFEIRRQKFKKAFYKFIAEDFSEEVNKKKASTLRIGDVFEDEKNMTVTQLISFHGFQAETHSVQSRDGYVLDIHRILSVSPKSVKGKEKVALLHHGLMGSSEDWLLLGPGRALPYLLSDAGYDVWLTNARGNKYSRFNHGYVVLEASALWDFSFHEMGYFDLAAVIDYIQSRNKNELEIHFVGHSMGGTALLVLLSTLPQYNQVLHSATLLAPLAFMFQIKGPFKLLAEFYKANGRHSLNFVGQNEFMLKKNFPHQFIDKFCISTQKLCTNPLLFLANGGNIDLETNILENFQDRIPERTSTKTIVHYLQLVNNGKFQYFDYGASENIKKHGVTSAPTYDLSKVVLSIHLITSHDDWLCTNSNVQKLLDYLPKNAIHHKVYKSDFSHTDFVWGKNAPELVYCRILNFLENTDYSKGEELNLPCLD